MTGRGSRIALGLAASAGVVLAALLLLWQQRSPAAPRHPNILFITIDSLRADHVGAYGYQRATSPAIDALAQEGILFSRAVAQTNWTYGSVPSFITSRYPQSHRRFFVDGDRRAGDQPPRRGGPPGPVVLLGEQDVLLPRALKERGYHTALLTDHVGLKQIVTFKTSFHESERLPLVPGEERLGEPAVARLATLASHQPFFFWVYSNRLHCPYRPPPPFDTRFQNDGRYATGRRVTLSQERFVARDAVPVMSQLGGRDDYDYYVAAYDGCVAAADYLVARLVAELRRLELEDETVVVVTADHGESLGEEGAFFTHGDVLNPSAVHVPLVLRLPRAAHAGARVAGAVSLVDLAPTLLELAGVSPVRMAPVGRSLAPCFAEPARCAGGLAYSSAPRARQRSVATEQWFLRCGRESPCQLFDFADPASDRSGEYPAEAARLEAALAEWLRRYPEGEGPLGIETLDPETRAALEQLGYLH